MNFTNTKDHGANSNPFSKFKMPNVDYAKLMSSNQKNLAAIQAAHQSTAEAIKSLSSLQAKFMQQTFDDMSSMMRLMMSKNTPQSEKIERVTESFVTRLNSNLEHVKTVATTLIESGYNTSSVINQRIAEGIKEMHEQVKPTQH